MIELGRRSLHRTLTAVALTMVLAACGGGKQGGEQGGEVSPKPYDGLSKLDCQASGPWGAPPPTYLQHPAEPAQRLGVSEETVRNNTTYGPADCSAAVTLEQITAGVPAVVQQIAQLCLVVGTQNSPAGPTNRVEVLCVKPQQG